MVDDEIIPGEYYAETLSENGITVDVARTTEQALAFLNTEVFYHVVFLDVLIHESDSIFTAMESAHGLETGFVFYERYVRALRPITPVIFLTHSANHYHAVKIQQFPSCKLIHKVETLPGELVEIVRAIVKDSMETLFEDRNQSGGSPKVVPLITNFREEVLRWFAKHPERLYHLSARQFEELVAEILSDMGLDVELTKATRDGGVDIYARLRHEVGSFLMVVECKRYAPENAVGIGVVQRLYGIQQTQRANKGLIVTTSYFSEPAIQEANKLNNMIDLDDYQALKTWLARYK